MNLINTLWKKPMIKYLADRERSWPKYVSTNCGKDLRYNTRSRSISATVSSMFKIRMWRFRNYDVHTCTGSARHFKLRNN